MQFLLVVVAEAVKVVNLNREQEYTQTAQEAVVAVVEETLLLVL
jgi:hypothetical protein